MAPFALAPAFLVILTLWDRNIKLRNEAIHHLTKCLRKHSASNLSRAVCWQEVLEFKFRPCSNRSCNMAVGNRTNGVVDRRGG